MCLYKTKIIYNTKGFYLWESKDFLDHFLVCDGKILCFYKESEFENYINNNGLSVIDEDTVFKIISKKELIFLKQKDTTSFCNTMLDTWNLAIDIKNSFSNKENLLDGHKRLYDKIFHGCNLECITAPDAKYIPQFSTLENRQIRAIINESYKWFDCKLEQF